MRVIPKTEKDQAETTSALDECDVYYRSEKRRAKGDLRKSQAVVLVQGTDKFLRLAPYSCDSTRSEMTPRIAYLLGVPESDEAGVDLIFSDIIVNAPS